MCETTAGTRLWSQDKKAEHALVYYHGYTNAPPQFKLLGEDPASRL